MDRFGNVVSRSRPSPAAMAAATAGRSDGDTERYIAPRRKLQPEPRLHAFVGRDNDDRESPCLPDQFARQSAAP